MRKKRGSLLRLERRNPKTTVQSVIDEMSSIAEELVCSAETGAQPPDIHTILRLAVDVTEWRKHVREKSIVQGTLYLPRIIKKMAEKAIKEGDIQAARLLFDYLDVIPRKAGQGVTVATQINITPQELDEIRKEVGVEEVR